MSNWKDWFVEDGEISLPDVWVKISVTNNTRIKFTT